MHKSGRWSALASQALTLSLFLRLPLVPFFFPRQLQADGQCKQADHRALPAKRALAAAEALQLSQVGTAPGTCDARLEQWGATPHPAALCSACLAPKTRKRLPTQHPWTCGPTSRTRRWVVRGWCATFSVEGLPFLHTSQPAITRLPRRRRTRTMSSTVSLCTVATACRAATTTAL